MEDISPKKTKRICSEWIRHPVLKILLLIQQTTIYKLVFDFSILIQDVYKNADSHLTVVNNPVSSLLMVPPKESCIISYLNAYEGKKKKKGQKGLK